MTQMHHIRSEYQFDGLEEFAYIVTHEIRNASRALTEIPHWICEDLSADGQSISAETAENLDLLVRHSKRLDQMLKDLLAYSEVGRGSSPEPIKLETLVEDALAATDLPPGFKIELEGLSGEVLLPSEEAPRLARIAIQNAVQHGPPSGGQLRISSRIQNGKSVSDLFAADFTAIDFETANKSRDSACQLAAVRVRSGVIVHEAMWMIRPQPLRFSPGNIRVHGITPNDVKNELEFGEIWNEIHQRSDMKPSVLL